MIMVVTKDDDDGGGGEDYDDEIFIKLSPHANQLAQDHPLLKRLVRRERERDFLNQILNEVFSMKQNLLFKAVWHLRI